MAGRERRHDGGNGDKQTDSIERLLPVAVTVPLQVAIGHQSQGSSLWRYSSLSFGKLILSFPNQVVPV